MPLPGNILTPHNSSLRRAVAGTAAALRDKLDSPGLVQRAVLSDILSRNETSAYGTMYGFCHIRNPADFQMHVPVVTYEELTPWIERIAQGEQSILTAEPVVAFEETGGSIGGRKLIPYTIGGLAAFRCGLLPWLDDLFFHCNEIASGAFYWAISPACRTPSTTPGGVPIGLPNDAAYLGPEIGAAIIARLAVPPEAGTIADFDSWRDYTMRHLLACENLSMISVWSPTFLTELLEYAKQHRDKLAAAISESGNSARARHVASVLSQPSPDYAALWPQLRLISCWDHASARPVARRLRQQFPTVHVQGKGLLATEGLVTIPLTGYAFPVLALESAFFEFVDDNGRIWFADDMQENELYRLLMTTHSGLYRYDIGDMVAVRGFAGRTPMLEFVGRSNAASDLCGEKLTDSFVTRQLVLLDQNFAMLAPAIDSRPRGYVLLLDADAVSSEESKVLALRLDALLYDNPQYAYARRLGQLTAVTPVRCRTPAANWLEHRARSKGVRLGDVKLPSLHAGSDWMNWVRI